MQTLLLFVNTKTLKARSYLVLLKLRLSLLVAFSGCIGFIYEAQQIDFAVLLGFAFGSLFITGAANTINQILEQEYDALMKRTANRPLPAGELGVSEAFAFALAQVVFGVLLMLIFVGVLPALISLVSLVLYSFVYTPLKRISPLSVLVGAVPGALPPLIGCVAGAGDWTLSGWVFFAVQFFWQFPHFWAIAWLGSDDYKHAGFKMLPDVSGKVYSNSVWIFGSTLLMLPVGLLPYFMGVSGLFTAFASLLLGLFFLKPSYDLLMSQDNRSALKLMFASFLYLPIMQLIMLFDKV
jgi:protoheme IX farnesyltransferase